MSALPLAAATRRPSAAAAVAACPLQQAVAATSGRPRLGRIPGTPHHTHSHPRTSTDIIPPSHPFHAAAPPARSFRVNLVALAVRWANRYLARESRRRSQRAHRTAHKRFPMAKGQGTTCDHAAVSTVAGTSASATMSEAEAPRATETATRYLTPEAHRAPLVVLTTALDGEICTAHTARVSRPAIAGATCSRCTRRTAAEAMVLARPLDVFRRLQDLREVPAPAAGSIARHLAAIDTLGAMTGVASGAPQAALIAAVR